MDPGLPPLLDLEPSHRGTMRGRSGHALAYARWDREAPRGRAVLLHGYGEHGERYRHTAAWLHGLGWAVSALDQQGFGRSEGVRGDAQGIRGFVEDLARFLRQERRHDQEQAGVARSGVEGEAPPLHPQVLLGHSFGGLVASLTLLWHPDTLDGLVLSSPAIHLKPLPLHARIGLVVLGMLAPHWSFHAPSGKERVCTDPRLVERFGEDPLCHQFLTAAFGQALYEGERELVPYGSEVDRPVLVLEAGEDVLIDHDAADRLWNAVPPELLERHRLPGLKHELLHDLRREDVQAQIAAWLERRFPG